MKTMGKRLLQGLDQKENRIRAAASSCISAGKPSGSGLRFSVLFPAIIAAPLLSACVGQTVNDTLDSAALQSPAAGTIEDISDDYVSDFSSVAAIPVPQRSPNSSELALASTEATPAANAANSVITETSATPPEADLRTAALQSGETTNEDAAEEIAEDEEVALASVEPPVPAPSPVTSAPTAPAPAASVKPAKNPGGLFGALFGNGQKAQPQKPAPKQLVVARNDTATRNASANALPGVKRDSALFGINESDRGRPVSEADQNVQVASVGTFGRYQMVNGLVLQTERVQVDCFKPELMNILKKVERRYGKKVMVTSGYRSPKGNRNAGGVRNSTHIYCKAADIQVEGISKWDLAKYLRTVDGRGGVGTYCRTNSVHIDVGSVRDWHHPCRRSKSRTKKKA